MAHEIPSSENFTGLSRKVLQYSELFGQIVERLKEPNFSDATWAPLEDLVDVENFVRQGVFLTDKPETIGWQTYKSYITQYGGATHWEATLRHITEGPNRVVLELQERNTRNGFTHVANTVMAYGFDDYGRVKTLEVYVMSLN
ncbi:MAG: hypothetical protein ACLQUZ_13095 [Rhizomicrobium sp.]